MHEAIYSAVPFTGHRLMARRLSPPLMLRRKPQRPAWISVAWRAAAVLGLLALIILVHWLERASLVDQLDGHVSFKDVIYFTMISATTTGYGDIVPVTDSARMFDALVVTPIRVFFVLIFVGTAYTFVLRRTWDRWIMARLQGRLTDHIVVAGFGTSGSKAVEELVARGTDPGQIVVVETNPAALERAETLGCITLEADAARDSALEAVRVAAAKLMIISAGRDDTSILICLTARHLAPDLLLSVAIRAEDNELLARQAGANIVINPVSFTGLLLAGAAHGRELAEYMTDLASTRGRVHLAERVVSASERGKPLSAITTGLGVRVYRNGVPIGFWEPGVNSLEPGDKIVEIVAGVRSEAAPIE